MPNTNSLINRWTDWDTSTQIRVQKVIAVAEGVGAVGFLLFLIGSTLISPTMLQQLVLFAAGLLLTLQAIRRVDYISRMGTIQSIHTESN